MINVIGKGYAFDDVLLVPKFSNIESRSSVDTSIILPKDVKLSIPLVSANMKTVTGPIMAKAIACAGGLAILHRFATTQQYIEDFKSCFKTHANIGVSVGVHGSEPLEQVIELGCKIVCVDVAHGHSTLALETVTSIAKRFPHALLIAGNVATVEGARALRDAGADIIKVGIGPGSLCSTRVETGNGVPQLTALSTIKAGIGNTPIIADGGIKQTGDVVKSLCFADLVMLGNMLAGTDEAPGDVEVINGQQYKSYVGSSTHKTNHIEGVVARVPYKGPVQNVITKIVEGLRSGMSYQGVKNLKDLKTNPQFIEVSHAGLVESRPHSVIL